MAGARDRSRCSTLDIAVILESWRRFNFVQSIVTFLHVAPFQKSEEVSCESCALVSVCCLWKRSCGETTCQGCRIVNPGSADFGGRPALCEPRSADFVAGVALYEPRSADFVAGVALYEPRCRFRGRHAQHFVSLEVQIS